MSEKLENQPLSKRSQHLLEVISSPKFMERQGLGNEVPFYICPFEPEETVGMREVIENLIEKLTIKDITVFEINLYDLCIETLKQRNIWDLIMEKEPDIPKEQLLELLQSTLDPETHVIPEIEKKINRKKHFHVMFLTGIGEVFPFIRSHNVLNNLQRIARDTPTVMFFPGAYTHSPAIGASLSLFKKFHNDRYYRAFNIFNTSR